MIGARAASWALGCESLLRDECSRKVISDNTRDFISSYMSCFDKLFSTGSRDP